MKIALFFCAFLLGNGVSAGSIFMNVKIHGKCLGVLRNRPIVGPCNSRDRSQYWYWAGKHLMNNVHWGKAIYIVQELPNSNTYLINLGDVGNGKEFDWKYQGGYLKNLYREGLNEIGALSSTCAARAGCQPTAKKFNSKRISNSLRSVMQWDLRSNIGFYYTIKNVPSGKCLGLATDGYYNVRMETCRNTAEHLWRFDGMHIYNGVRGKELALHLDVGDYLFEANNVVDPKGDYAIGAITLAPLGDGTQWMWKFEDGFLKNMYLSSHLDISAIPYYLEGQNRTLSRGTSCDCSIGGKSVKWDYVGDEIAKWYWQWRPVLQPNVY